LKEKKQQKALQKAKEVTSNKRNQQDEDEPQLAIKSRTSSNRLETSKRKDAHGFDTKRNSPHNNRYAEFKADYNEIATSTSTQVTTKQSKKTHLDYSRKIIPIITRETSTDSNSSPVKRKNYNVTSLTGMKNLKRRKSRLSNTGKTPGMRSKDLMKYDKALNVESKTLNSNEYVVSKSNLFVEDPKKSDVFHDSFSVTNSKSKSYSYLKKDTPRVNLPLRKCHNCNLSRSSYLRCHFWFMNGTKCGKIFCKDCLTSTYGLKNYDSIYSDHEWHCPACLGTCTCKQCVRQRERSEKRAATLDRRTTSRTSAGFYSF